MEETTEKDRVAVVGIIVNNREDSAKRVNDVLSDYGTLIIARMGLPHREKGISIISLILDGTNEEIGALSGKLGNIKNVKVKVSYMI